MTSTDRHVLPISVRQRLWTEFWDGLLAKAAEHLDDELEDDVNEVIDEQIAA